jgi:hypothetical protein
MNARILCIFGSDGVFGNHTSSDASVATVASSGLMTATMVVASATMYFPELTHYAQTMRVLGPIQTETSDSFTDSLLSLSHTCARSIGWLPASA